MKRMRKRPAGWIVRPEGGWPGILNVVRGECATMDGERGTLTMETMNELYESMTGHPPEFVEVIVKKD